LDINPNEILIQAKLDEPHSTKLTISISSKWFPPTQCKDCKFYLSKKDLLVQNPEEAKDLLKQDFSFLCQAQEQLRKQNNPFCYNYLFRSLPCD